MGLFLYRNIISLLIISLVLLSGCRGGNAEVDEEAASPIEENVQTPTDVVGESMGTDMGVDMGMETEMATDVLAGSQAPPGPEEKVNVVVKREDIVAAFPEYPAAHSKDIPKEITVYYATDRSPVNSKEPNTAFGRERSNRGEIHWGTCTVTIPKTHKLGVVEGPNGLTREENPRRHIVLAKLSRMSRDLFIATLRTSVGSARRKELLVFVHGFNVEFKDAARRTAQLAVDLEFEGIPVFYSWPAQGSMTTGKYKIDQENARWTVPHLEKFLAELADNSGATEIHLIAHSMGADALTQALTFLARGRSDKLPIFTDIVLAAPDMDRDSFLDFADDFKRAGSRFTLYASSNDKALKIAKRIKNFPRAGDSGAGILLVPGIETIDASEADRSVPGHFYYGSSAPILADLAALIKDGKAAGERFRLDDYQKDGMTYWRVRR